MRVRLTTHGWPKGLLKIQTPIRIHLYRNYTKCRERARPPRLTQRLRAVSKKRAGPATFPVSTSRTLFCLPQCFSSPARQESSSSSACVHWLSSSPLPCSSLRSYGRPSFRCEGIYEPAPEVIRTSDCPYMA